MKLYMVPAAPNPTRVMLYLAEKAAAGNELPIQQVVVNTLKGAQRSDEHLARNPFGTLPVLEIEPGDYVIESLCIIDYLEEQFPDAPMWGTSPRARAHARQLERIAELKVMGPIGQYIHATNSPIGLPKDPAAAARTEQTLPTALGYLDGLLSDGRAHLAGDAVTVADCTLQAGFQFMRFGKADLIAGFDHLARWDNAYRARSPAQSVLKF